MAGPTKHQLAKHPDYVEAIGMIALETVDLELQLADLFSRMLFISPRVGRAIFMTPKGDQARIDILRHAAHAALAPKKKASPSSKLERQKADALKRVLEIAQRSLDAFNARHRVMHDDWRVDGDLKKVTRIRVDGSPGRSAAPVPITKLEEQIETLRRLIDDVIDLTNDFDQHPPTLADMRRALLEEPAKTQ